jgi:hypothetical protein
MEQVIQFLEEYWGVSIAGGVTVGTLLTFIVVQVKAILQSNLLRTQSTSQLSSSAQLVKDIAQKYSALESRHQELEAKDKYLELVNLATFKALSFIVIASKLPIEDKLALQAEFEKLKQPIASVVVKEEVKTEQPLVINEVVTNVVEAAADLLSKYTESK